MTASGWSVRPPSPRRAPDVVAYTGIGSLPGTDFGAALRMTFDEVADFPHLPELPDRGPWAQLIGRGLGLPGGLSADLQAGEWRLTDAVGVDQRRARATWRDDLDRLEEYAGDYAGRFKVAVAGPWTLAATLGVAHAGRVLADQGARRDLAQSMAESLKELVQNLTRRLPQARVVVQLDEPGLPAVAAGAVPTPGGFFRHRAVDVPELARGLEWVVDGARAAGVSELVLHSCAPWSGPGKDWPMASLRQTGLTGMSLDIDTLSASDEDALAEAAEGGLQLYLGVVPTTGSLPGVDDLVTRTLRLVDRLGGVPSGQLVLTPACGLAGWTSTQVIGGLRRLAQATTAVSEELGKC